MIYNKNKPIAFQVISRFFFSFTDFINAQFQYQLLRKFLFIELNLFLNENKNKIYKIPYRSYLRQETTKWSIFGAPLCW